MCESGYGIDPDSGQCVDLCSLQDSANCGAISGCVVSSNGSACECNGANNFVSGGENGCQCNQANPILIGSGSSARCYNVETAPCANIS